MATIIPALPYILSNGTIADANQVMADFNDIVSSVNANGAANGANADITSLSGLTTPLSVVQGGTGLNASGAAGNVLSSNGSLWQSVNPKLGVIDGSNAAAGIVGEYIFVSGGPSAVGTANPTSIGTLPLPAGDWNVWSVAQLAAGAANCSVFIVSLGATLNA